MDENTVIKVDNDAYAFCAKSGTGKTTHTKLWMQLLGDRMSYINGDKPLIRIIDDQIYISNLGRSKFFQH